MKRLRPASSRLFRLEDWTSCARDMRISYVINKYTWLWAYSWRRSSWRWLRSPVQTSGKGSSLSPALESPGYSNAAPSRPQAIQSQRWNLSGRPLAHPRRFTTCSYSYPTTPNWSKPLGKAIWPRSRCRHLPKPYASILAGGWGFSRWGLLKWHGI